MTDGKKITIELQSLIDVQEHPFVLIDADYQIVAANQAYSMAYGLTPEESVGRFCHEVSHHSDVPCHKNGEHCPHQQVFATGQPCQAVHVHFDQMNRPERVRLKGYPVRSADGTLYLGETVFPLDCSEAVDCEEMRMIGRSPAFLNCVDNLTSAAESEASVLLFGESGVGKELAAQYVHKRSSRNGRAFLAVDCAAITESLFESELFGHERGAFTGCIGRKQGLFELADRGTLFLDEIGEVPLTMQAKLLRVLETGEFRRVGGRESLKADVRIVSATNRNLLEMVDMGRFRLDLYYRISGIDIHLPSLRERKSDIPALADTLLSRIVGAGMRYRLTAEAITLLQAYSYPGNIRELRNILLKAAALSANGIIGAEQILLKEFNIVHKDQRQTDVLSYSKASEASPSMTQLEAQYIADLLVQHNGRRRTVADILGISERTLYRKLNLYQLS